MAGIGRESMIFQDLAKAKFAGNRKDFHFAQT
jgi:hypothetical protein